MVATVLLLKFFARETRLSADQVPPILSTACIFLPEGDANFGVHHLNDVDPTETQAGHCFCHKLYGEPMDWGCEWFHLWRLKLEEVLDKGQAPVVVYKADEVGEGDDVAWEHFPIPFSTEHRGLGGSQKGEVAYLKRRLAERGLGGFEKKDVNAVSDGTTRQSYQTFDGIIEGPAGGAAFAGAIEHCTEVHEALGTLVLDNADLGDVGGVALARSLAHLRALQRLELRLCGLGKEAGQAVSASLQHLPRLAVLSLAGNRLGQEGGTSLAANLHHVPQLKSLGLSGNDLGERGGKALAAKLRHLPQLEGLWLDHNELGDEAGKALAASLRHLPELKALWLQNNQLGEEAGKVLAANLRHAPQLEQLELDSTGLKEGAGLALAASLLRRPKLRELCLLDNSMGELAERQLRLEWHGDGPLWL